MTHQSYIISLDYGKRQEEREFVRSILKSYDKDCLVGCILFVNNNPYSLCSYLFLNFEERSSDFEAWLKRRHPKRPRVFDYFLPDFMESIPRRAFNVVTFCDPDDGLLDLIMSGEANEVYLFPDEERMSQRFGVPMTGTNFTVFLSHSSKDKSYVDDFFEALHKSGVAAWYDRYQISPGDSITSKINEGLRNSRIGILFLSKNFLSNERGWPIREANYFFQSTINDPDKKFIVVNLGLNHSEIPPLLQDHLYIDGSSKNAMDSIIGAIKASL